MDPRCGSYMYSHRTGDALLFSECGERKHQSAARVVAVVFIAVLAECEFHDERNIASMFLYLLIYFVYPCIDTGSSAAAVYEVESGYRSVYLLFSSSSVLPTDAISSSTVASIRITAVPTARLFPMFMEPSSFPFIGCLMAVRSPRRSFTPSG